MFSVAFSLMATQLMHAQQSMDLLFQTGKVVKNYPRFPELKPSFAGRLSWNSRLNGKKEWHQWYYFPEFTLQGLYSSLGNKEELGSLAGISGGFRFLKDIDYRFALTAEAGLGIAFFNRPYNEFTNGGNIAIGSGFTALGTADAGVIYSFHPKWALVGKLSIVHGSNAHISLPNAGINLPMVTAGIRYRPDPAMMLNTSAGESVTDKKPSFTFRVALGRGEQGGTAGPVNGPLYSIYLASLYINRHYTPVARWQTGIEGYYNDGTYTFITSRRFYPDKERLRSFSVLYMLGHEYIFGHVGFVTQGGLYLYNPFARDYNELMDGNTKDLLKTWLAARLGVHYYLYSPFYTKHKNIFAGCYVKTNFGKADFLEMTIGYAF